jgi:hypothetical protein
MQREKEIFQLFKEDMQKQKKAFLNQESRLELQIKQAAQELDKAREQLDFKEKVL